MKNHNPYITLNKEHYFHFFGVLKQLVGEATPRGVQSGGTLACRAALSSESAGSCRSFLLVLSMEDPPIYALQGTLWGTYFPHSLLRSFVASNAPGGSQRADGDRCGRLRVQHARPGELSWA